MSVGSRSSSSRSRCSSWATRSSSSSHSSRVTRPSSRARSLHARRVSLADANRVAAPARAVVVDAASELVEPRPEQRSSRSRLGGRYRARPCGLDLRRWRRRSRLRLVVVAVAVDRRALDHVERRRRRRLLGGGAPPPAARIRLRHRALRRRLRRWRRAYSGSRCFQSVTIGAAMKIDEYAPDVTPTSSANAKSFSVAPPKRNSAPTGSSVMNVVASERRIVSHSDTFDDRRERRAPHDRDVLADAVEDDDRVVDRVSEHGQDRGDRRLASPRARSSSRRRP